MTITGEEIIFRYCMGMLNPSPDYYAGRGNSVHDLNSSILEMLYGGIRTEISPDAARMFVNMVKNLKNTNAQSFLNEYYRMEKKGWRWTEPVMKVRVATAAASVPAAGGQPVAGTADKPPVPPAPARPEELDAYGMPVIRKPMVEISNAFARSVSLFGHDKAVTQGFLDRHRDEVDSSAFETAFGG